MSKQLTKRQAQRLLNVSRALREALIPEAFTMDAYVHDYFVPAALENQLDAAYDANDDAKIEELEQKTEDFCGTPACALGHYGSRRDLQRVIRIGSSRFWGTGLFYGNNKQADYSDPKLLKHFGIDEDQAYQLFSGDGCNGAQTAVQAAAYIERFVQSHYG